MDLLFKYVFIPLVLALVPVVLVIINLYKNDFEVGSNKIKYTLFFLVSLGFLAFSYLNVWSLVYGPMSKEDWGPGFVKAMGIVSFQIIPLIITIPLAIWVIRSGKNNINDQTDSAKCTSRLP